MQISGHVESTTTPPCLDIVVPCYNEEEVLPDTYSQLHDLLNGLIASNTVDTSSRIVFVNDGSQDDTWAILTNLAEEKSDVVALGLARNSGHQNALLAGMEFSSADAVLTIDADLQDDVHVVPEMLEKFNAGNDVIYGVRRRRDSDTFFKRASARAYYRLLKFMGVSVVPDHADFRLMSACAVKRLLSYPEVNLYLRGIVPLIGNREAVVQYDRQARMAGETKYPLRRMVGLAVDGITSFSAVPLRLIAALGFLVFVLSIGMTGWILWIRIFTDAAVPGWASSVIPVYFLGGIQLLSIGVVGEYIAKIYMESKSRPRYFVQSVVGGSKNTPKAQVDQSRTQGSSVLNDKINTR